MRIRTITAAAAIAAAVTLTGCSSSSSDGTATPSSTAPAATKAAADNGKAALTAAVRAYSDAYFKPDSHAAGALLSDRCRAQISADVYDATLTQAVATYGHQAISTITVDSLSGDMARVTYTYTVPALDQHAQPWVREAGAWHYDAC